MSKVAVPKPQAYPASVITVGAVLWSVLAWTDENTGKTSTEYEEWHVRSIKARRGSKSRLGHAMFAQGDDSKRVNLTQKVQDLTWVKSKGKLGWAKSIEAYLTRQFHVGDPLPTGIYTTQRAALAHAIRKAQESRVMFEKWVADAKDDAEREEMKGYVAECDAEIRALATRFTKQFGKKKEPA